MTNLAMFFMGKYGNDGQKVGQYRNRRLMNANASLSKEKSSTNMPIKEIPLTKIKRDPNRPRKSFHRGEAKRVYRQHGTGRSD